MPFRVGVVDDDARMRRAVVHGLQAESLLVPVSAGSGREFLEALQDHRIDVAVVDVGLPDCDGRDLCLAMRGQGLDVPVLMLTARDGVVDRLQGFSAGADDYVVKPFAFAELLARVNALARRHTADRQVDGVRLDPLQHQVLLSGPQGVRAAAMTPTEFRLLSALMARPGQVVRRRSLVASAWPAGGYVADNTLDSYIGRIRRKLRELESDAGPAARTGPDETAPIGTALRVVTVHGIGYRADLSGQPVDHRDG